MSEVELILLNNSDKCTVYTIQFLGDELDEFNKFVAKFRENSQLNADYRAIIRYSRKRLRQRKLPMPRRASKKLSRNWRKPLPKQG